MVNCLSNVKFENLLFVNVRIKEYETIALFDTGAGMTVIARSVFKKLNVVEESEPLTAGNNNGLVRTLQTAIVSNILLGDILIDELKVIVMDDSDFAFSDEDGTAFPAEMLLGWDVISRYSWKYSVKDESLSVGISKSASTASDPDAKQEPIVFPEYCGYLFKAGVDTGHTSSILNSSWCNRLSDIEYHETEIVGIGSVRYESTPYVRNLRILFQGRAIHLKDVDICDKLYGQPADMEALLGYDFLEGRDWQLDQELYLL